MIQEKNETFLWYFPDGTASSIENSTSPDAMPTDGWGSSSMLWAFMEGLVGIQDQGRMLDTVRLCPRWSAAGVTSAECSMGYEASGTKFAYQYEETANGINLEIETAQSDVQLHLLLPEGANVQDLQIQGQSMEMDSSTRGSSRYVDCQLKVSSSTKLSLRYK